MTTAARCWNRLDLAIVWLLAGGFIAGQAMTSAAAQDDVLKTQAAHLAAMTVEERAHFEKNLAAFRALSPAEQAQFRSLHAQVQGDAQLRQMMTTYTTWLKTLTPGQIDELRQETDLARRRNLVEKFRKDQLAKSESNWPGAPLGNRATRPGPLAQIPAKDLDGVFQILARSLPVGVREQLPAHDTDIHRLARFARILEYSVRDQEPGAWLESLDTDELQNAVATPEFQQQVLRSPQPELRRRSLLMLLLRVVEQNTNSLLQPLLPSDEQLQGHFSQLTPSQSFDLRQLSQEDFRRELSRSYLEAHPNPQLQQLLATRETLQRFRQQIFPGRFGGPQRLPGGPRGFRPGEGPPPEGRPPGREEDGPPFRDNGGPPPRPGDRPPRPPERQGPGFDRPFPPPDRP